MGKPVKCQCPSTARSTSPHPPTQGAFLFSLLAFPICPQPSQDRTQSWSFSMFSQTSLPHSFCFLQFELLPLRSSAFPVLCALADSSFSSPSVLSSPSPLSQLTPSGDRHLCMHLHLKSQWLSQGNSCPAASDTELTSLSPHTEHVPAGSSNEVISLHTQWSTLQLVELPSY